MIVIAHDSGGEGATPEERFQRALDELLREARVDGVDVEGGWRCSGGEGPDWEVLISRVVEDGDSHEGNP